MSTKDEHTQTIENALDAFAEDSDVSLADYVDGLAELMVRVEASYAAARDDLLGRPGGRMQSQESETETT